MLIDGGQGQLSAAMEVMNELDITNLPVVVDRQGAGPQCRARALLHAGSRRLSVLDPKDPVLYFLQRLRDEAHRFAIGTHRARRTKAIGAVGAR